MWELVLAHLEMHYECSKVYTGFRGACAPIRGSCCLLQQDDAKLHTYCKSLHSVCTSILLSILIFWALRLCKITAFVMFDPSLFSYSRPLQRWRWCIRTGCRWSQSVCRPDESAVSSPSNLSATVWEFSSNSSRQRTEASTGSPSTLWVCSHTSEQNLITFSSSTFLLRKPSLIFSPFLFLFRWGEGCLLHRNRHPAAGWFQARY